MKTRCPNCQTSFRITPEQLKARVGKVRCGQCQTVFNALDSLLEEAEAAPVATKSAAYFPASTASAQPSPPPAPAVTAATLLPAADVAREAANEALAAARDDAADDAASAVDAATPQADENDENDESDDDAPAGGLSVSEAQELGRATGLIMPRETTAIPGYSKWVEGMVTAPLALPREKASRWPFVVVAALLVLVLAGQVVFRWRSEIVIAMPSLRPAIAALAQAAGAGLPLPRRVELVSIESSDLQSDPKLGNLLVLNATLRNRASYAQAYPSLELALTDTQDAAIARRVFSADDYLAPAIAAGGSFSANSDVVVKLWIEAQQLTAAGYRLYVFYP